MTQISKLSRIRYQLKTAIHVVYELGFNPINTILFFKRLPFYIYEFVKFYWVSKKSDQNFPIVNLLPCLIDKYECAGRLSKHYFHQDLWAARKIYQNNPERHIDVGSRIDGFVAHVLTFRDIEILDVRPMTSKVSGMSFRQADVMQLDSIPEKICDSVSCLHALEHFGLGRYGDPIDPEGHIKGLKSLTKLLQTGGKLLLSVPIGVERVEFNGHRVFSVETILSLTKTEYELISFSYIDDQDDFHENIDTTKVKDMLYGCGLFEFKKYK